MQYTLIVPPNIETMVSGLVLAAEKSIGKTHWRVEIYNSETFPRIYKNGRQLAAACICPESAIKFANTVVAQWNEIKNINMKG